MPAKFAGSFTNPAVCHNAFCARTSPGDGPTCRWHIRNFGSKDQPNHVTLCNACKINFDQGKYCPFCFQVYRERDPDEFDNKQWLCCSSRHCHRWVHRDCDTWCLTSASLADSPDHLTVAQLLPSKTYTCPGCRELGEQQQHACDHAGCKCIGGDRLIRSSRRRGSAIDLNSDPSDAPYTGDQAVTTTPAAGNGTSPPSYKKPKRASPPLPSSSSLSPSPSKRFKAVTPSPSRVQPSGAAANSAVARLFSRGMAALLDPKLSPAGFRVSAVQQVDPVDPVASTEVECNSLDATVNVSLHAAATGGTNGWETVEVRVGYRDQEGTFPEVSSDDAAAAGMVEVPVALWEQMDAFPFPALLPAFLGQGSHHGSNPPTMDLAATEEVYVQAFDTVTELDVANQALRAGENDPNECAIKGRVRQSGTKAGGVNEVGVSVRKEGRRGSRQKEGSAEVYPSWRVPRKSTAPSPRGSRPAIITTSRACAVTDDTPAAAAGGGGGSCAVGVRIRWGVDSPGSSRCTSPPTAITLPSDHHPGANSPEGTTAVDTTTGSRAATAAAVRGSYLSTPQSINSAVDTPAYADSDAAAAVAAADASPAGAGATISVDVRLASDSEDSEEEGAGAVAVAVTPPPEDALSPRVATGRCLLDLSMLQVSSLRRYHRKYVCHQDDCACEEDLQSSVTEHFASLVVKEEDILRSLLSVMTRHGSKPKRHHDHASPLRLQVQATRQKRSSRVQQGRSILSDELCGRDGPTANVKDASLERGMQSVASRLNKRAVGKHWAKRQLEFEGREVLGVQ